MSFLLGVWDFPFPFDFDAFIITSKQIFVNRVLGELKIYFCLFALGQPFFAFRNDGFARFLTVLQFWHAFFGCLRLNVVKSSYPTALPLRRRYRETSSTWFSHVPLCSRGNPFPSKSSEWFRPSKSSFALWQAPRCLSAPRGTPLWPTGRFFWSRDAQTETVE